MPRPKSTGNKPLPANQQKGKKICTCCKQTKGLASGFYISKSPLYAIDGRLPVCKDCIADMCVNTDTGEIDEIELNKCLRKFDKPYYKNYLMSAYEQLERECSFLEKENIKKHGKEIIKLYFKNISMPQCIKKSYEDSEREGFIHHNANVSNGKTIKINETFADVNNKNCTDKNEINQSVNVKWSKEDKENMKYAIKAIGYDPFEDYPDENRKFLFNSLSPYLEDDDNVDDAYKLSQILQIIKNNFQIDTCDKKMSRLDPLKDAESIKILSDIKNKLVQSNDKIAKENEISVKNRSNKDAGKSTLTYLMRDLREKDFDKAEADYYDQLRSEGTRWAIDVSQKAILDHCVFDENDKKEIYETQLKLIDSLNQELDKKKEEIRLLLVKIDDLNLNIKKLEDKINGIS